MTDAGSDHDETFAEGADPDHGDEMEMRSDSSHDETLLAAAARRRQHHEATFIAARYT